MNTDVTPRYTACAIREYPLTRSCYPNYVVYCRSGNNPGDVGKICHGRAKNNQTNISSPTNERVGSVTNGNRYRDRHVPTFGQVMRLGRVPRAALHLRSGATG